MRIWGIFVFVLSSLNYLSIFTINVTIGTKLVTQKKLLTVFNIKWSRVRMTFVPPSHRGQEFNNWTARRLSHQGLIAFLRYYPGLPACAERIDTGEGGRGDGRGTRTKLPGCIMRIAMGIYMQLCRLRRCVTLAHYTTCFGIVYSPGNRS